MCRRQTTLTEHDVETRTLSCRRQSCGHHRHIHEARVHVLCPRLGARGRTGLARRRGEKPSLHHTAVASGRRARCRQEGAAQGVCTRRDSCTAATTGELGRCPAPRARSKLSFAWTKAHCPVHEARSPACKARMAGTTVLCDVCEADHAATKLLIDATTVLGARSKLLIDATKLLCSVTKVLCDVCKADHAATKLLIDATTVLCCACEEDHVATKLLSARTQALCTRAKGLLTRRNERCTRRDELCSRAIELCSRAIELCSRAIELCSRAIGLCSLAIEPCSLVGVLCTLASARRSRAHGLMIGQREACMRADDHCNRANGALLA
jgi:hypothetical protein